MNSLFSFNFGWLFRGFLLENKLKKWLSRLISLSFFLIVLSILVGCASDSLRFKESKQEALHPQIFKFKDGGGANYYSFNLGNPSEKSTVIFFVSGSGCSSVKRGFPGFFDSIKQPLDAHVFVLQKRGIDENKNGNACSSNFALTDYFDKTLSDQREFIDQLLALQSENPKAVLLMGASEGAVVAAKIASLDPRITHLALIGGGGSTVRENLQILSQKIWFLRAPDRNFASIDSDPGSISKAAWGHSYKYWSSILDINIGNLLLSLDIPIIMAMGEQDESVPIETAYALKKRFVGLGKSNFQLYAFPDADHRLHSKTSSHSYVKEFLDAVVEQIHREKAQ